MPRPYVALSITPDAREDVRRIVYAYTGRLGRKVEISETLTALAQLAEMYPDDLERLLVDATPN